jgi:hypothetical protein
MPLRANQIGSLLAVARSDRQHVEFSVGGSFDDIGGREMSPLECPALVGVEMKIPQWVYSGTDTKP